MRRFKISVAAVLVIILALMLTAASCFSGSSSTSVTSVSTSALKPQPEVESVVATTSGTEKAYYTTLDIKVKNNGAEGTILVIASVTQQGNTNSDQMPVFLKKGESHELKMTFPLVWEGGAFTPNVKTIVP
jgi:hypothetical protein